MPERDAHARVEVLGPIRLVDPAGRTVTPAGALQRRLLALLVLRRGSVLPADAAIAALWPTELPDDPFAALQNHVSRLRRSLPADAIRSVADGYLLAAESVELDADRLADAVARGVASAAAVERLLERWHGPAYPELADVDEARTEVLRLDELRVRARELLAEARLDAGDTDGLVTRLVALAEDEPLRERPRELLMTALATTGRHAEALRVFDDFRRLLGDELGIEPSPALGALHASILAGSAGTAWVPATRLPTPASSLIGRDALASEITTSAGLHRLVTLVGPGGVGKTRLLVEVGQRLLAERPERPVVLCELATADVASTFDVVASALGIDARPGTPLVRRITQVLRDTEVVLLLDNCEHVLDPTALLAEEVLAACPAVRVLATSRERLRIAGEQVCTVPTLRTSDHHAPAVELFVERARSVVPGFSPTDPERACIAEIVQRLDGLPLAIELAAARLHTHTVVEIAAGLGRRFALLSSGYRTSTRHGSLAAAVTWSFDLLDDALRRVLTDVSVFVGSFSAADAAAVCRLAEHDSEAALAQLVERSLVLRAPGSRYVLLETLRAFGSERLVADGRAAEVAARHAQRMVTWIEDADRRIAVPGEPALREIDDALPELRAALGWLLDHGATDLAGRLIAGLLDYGFLRLRPDVLEWAARVRAADPDDAGQFAADVWIALSYAVWMAGDVAQTAVCARRAFDISGSPRSAGAMANADLIDGRLDASAAWCRRSADEAIERGDHAEHLLAASTLLLALAYAGDPSAGQLAEELIAEHGAVETPYTAYLWYCAGEAVAEHDRALARTRLVRAVGIAERTGTAFVAGVAGATRTSIDARYGDPIAAADDYRRLIVAWRRAGMWSTQWTMLRSIAGLLARLGRAWEAAVLIGAILGTEQGHRIFGSDELVLGALADRLRADLGERGFEAAMRAGAQLDGEAAVEHALRSL